MELRRLPDEPDAVRRFVEELCVPHQHALAAAVEDHGIDDDADLVASQVAFRRDQIAAEGYEVIVAVDAPADGALADVEGELVGFVATDVDEAPAPFVRPDRLRVCECCVAEPHRGTGVAEELVVRAADRTRALDCPEVTLEVAADNERAIGFYERVGFEPFRRELIAATDGLAAGEPPSDLS